jgi:hypothetical protein
MKYSKNNRKNKNSYKTGGEAVNVKEWEKFQKELEKNPDFKGDELFTTCSICYESKNPLVSAFDCASAESNGIIDVICSGCADACIMTQTPGERSANIHLRLTMTQSKCPYCKGKVKTEYVNKLIEKLQLPEVPAEDLEEKNENEERLVHFMPRSISSTRVSGFDASIFTGAVFSLSNNAIQYLFHNRGSSRNIISLILLFIYTLYTISMSLRSSSGINPVSRIALVLIVLSSEYAMFQNNLQNLLDMFQGLNFPTITYPGQRGGGKKGMNEDVQSVNLSISFPKNATKKDIEEFCKKFFRKLFNPKVFPIVKTIITLPDVEFKMDDVHKSKFYIKLMRLNNKGSKSGKRTVKHGRKSTSSRRIRSSRSSQTRSLTI